MFLKDWSGHLQFCKTQVLLRVVSKPSGAPSGFPRRVKAEAVARSKWMNFADHYMS